MENQKGKSVWGYYPQGYYCGSHCDRWGYRDTELYLNALPLLLKDTTFVPHP